MSPRRKQMNLRKRAEAVVLSLWKEVHGWECRCDPPCLAG